MPMFATGVEDAFLRFIDWINCDFGTEEQRRVAEDVKYLIIGGDIVDGIGVYPNQDAELAIKDITAQYDEAARFLGDVRSDVKIIITPGNHDASRVAEPQPAVPEKYAKSLYELKNTEFISNPGVVSLDGINVLIYHGRGIDDMVMGSNDFSHERNDLVMKEFLTDFTEEELKACIANAYDDKFDTAEIAPLVKTDKAYYLELFHGATIAFKDMALSILPHLMTTSAKKNNAKNDIVILTATSGDTGKAALAGFADVPGTKIIVFYPKNGVSPIQEKQMVTQKGDNTFVVGIHGNFDDAQTGVKKIFADAEAFAGMSIEDYCKVVEAYKSTGAEGFSGMTRGEAFYQPMLEVVNYLLENDFIVYICSGTNRFTVRALIDGVIDIPARQVIGTDFTIVASGQGEEMDMHYSYTEDDLLMGGTLITKNVKMSKVAQMEQELGQKPVLVFGNSTGDVPMAIYADTDNRYLTEVFFILCDDTEREYGNISKAEKVASICAEYGWQTISMENDWSTIYGDGVSVAK